MVSLKIMNEKLKALEERLKLIGYVPSQKEDKSLYAKIKYYYERYPENQIVKYLKEKYPLPVANKKIYSLKVDLYEQIQRIEDRLRMWGRVPTSKEDDTLLHEVEYCYRKYNNLPEVKRLMALYPTNSLYSKWGKNVDSACGADSISIGGIVGYSREIENPFTRAMKYIKSCLENYNELPGINTWPMHFIFEKLTGNYRAKISNDLLTFTQHLIDRNLIHDESLIRKYYGSCLDQPFLKNRIDAILTEHSIVTIGYLSKVLVPGIQLDSQHIYNYFYYQEEIKYPHEGIQTVNRHCYRIFNRRLNVNETVVCVNFDNLLALDFQAIAKEIPYNILPSYNIQFSEEEDLNYAKSFLFHQDWIKSDLDKAIVKIDCSKTIFDDIKIGICPFQILGKEPYWDAIQLSVDWCYLLMNLDSVIIKEYIKTGYFSSLRDIIKVKENELTSDYVLKVSKIKAYISNKYGVQL